MLTRTWSGWSSALREAAACVGAGLRDIQHNGLWWRSGVWCMTATSFWLWLYFYFGSFFLKLSGKVAAISFLGIFSQSGVRFSSGGGVSNSLSGLGNLGSGLVSLANFLGSVVQIALLALAIAAIFYVLLFVVATITTIRLPLRWILLTPAKAAAHSRYPEWQPTVLAPLTPLTAWDRTLHGLTIVLALCIPVWALFLIVRVLLEWNVLLMYGPAAEGVLDEEQRRALVRRQRPAIVMLGLILCVLMLVPIFNLLVPALLCSSVCHLQRRGWVSAMPPALIATAV
jgi:hypothetical protein